MAHLVQYQDVTRAVLANELRNWAPARIQPQDLEKGIEFFVQIVQDKISKPESNPKKVLSWLCNEDASDKALDPVTEKIKAYVQDNAWKFQKTCERGFPFSLLDPRACMTSLKVALKKSESIIAHFLLQDADFLNEQELNARFAGPFKHVGPRGIAQACFSLHQISTQSADPRAGYYLLWLIKQLAEAEFEMPPKDTCTAEMVNQVLSDFVAHEGIMKQPHKFVEILLSTRDGGDQPLGRILLNSDERTSFMNFAANCLQAVPLHSWPAKLKVITDFLECAQHKYKLVLANALSSSTDELTAQIGVHLKAALEAASFREMIPHLYALQELLPHISIENIFNRPFPTFRVDPTFFNKDPSFTRRLQFDAERVFIEENLFIGVYGLRSKGFPPYLLAYDTSEKMVWGVALTSSLETNQPLETQRTFDLRDEIQQCGEFIIVQFQGTNEVHFIHSKTGEVRPKLLLPYETNKWSNLYFSPEGFCYQKVELNEGTILIGGKIVDGTWHTTFESNDCFGAFTPLSTHVGFKRDFDKLELFGPTGAHVTMNCLSARAKGNKLYMVQNDPKKAGSCILSVRELLLDERVLTEEIQQFQLDCPEASILELSDNGFCVLSSDSSMPIFINLLSSKVVYSQQKIEYNNVVNKKTGAIWSWENRVRQNLFKITPTEIIPMGKLKSGERTRLLHIDSEDHLFFADN